MTERRGSNFWLAWKDRKGFLDFEIHETVKRVTRCPIGQTQAKARLEAVADLRDLANAMTAGYAVQSIDSGNTFHETARLLNVSTSAVHKWWHEAHSNCECHSE